ncbi:hypothetical protein PSHT_07805 [Puccinia striiformis]|uniref:Uncharacterized protein n=2 Tax=Puccinia striiformis TaxID=27350 RepID=A0A2S4V928_9BASI|nr:hypothetical protein PSTT_09250 [Puccinia striiformis]POW13277.1 hypothetical protein PSHT_07805 [Puccinia striiformis]
MIQDKQESASANQFAAFNFKVQPISNQLDLAESSLDVMVNQMFLTMIRTVNSSLW